MCIYTKKLGKRLWEGAWYDLPIHLRAFCDMMTIVPAAQQDDNKRYSIVIVTNVVGTCDDAPPHHGIIQFT